MPPIQALHFSLQPNDNDRLAALAGQLDEHFRLLETRLGVEINNRGADFKVLGDDSHIQMAKNIMLALWHQTQTKKNLSAEQVHLQIQQVLNKSSAEEEDEEAYEAETKYGIQTKRGVIKPRGANQQQYIDKIRQNEICFGVGPAGTGKTYLAVACAVEALERQEVRRILLTRPAVEAGERLGFLPGDLNQKIDPYLRPLYDALYEMLGFEKVAKLIEKNIIEIAPLAYMRGRTLNEAFIILDESQNTLTEQMKMFLTRIGFNSKAVITGDITQTDLPHGKKSGLRHVIDVLQQVKGISFTFFQSRDVVRHPVVQRIVQAYERFEKINDEKN